MSDQTPPPIAYPRRQFQRGVIRALVHSLFFLLCDFRVEGKENLPKSGPLLIVGNHFSFIDPVALIRVTPYPLEFIAGNQMPNAPASLTWLTNTWDVIRVYRGNATRDGMRQAERVLSQGGVLGIFPEAGNWASVLRRARPGAAFLAARTQAPLLPIGIDGLLDIFPMLRQGKRATVRIRIGKPFGPYVVTGRGRQRREQLEEIGNDIGNSAYAAVVLLAVYSAYFQGTVAGDVEGGGSRLWGIAVGIAMFVVAITAPILGTLADFSGQKKRFLFFFTHLSILFTGMLFFVQAGDVLMGMVFFILAEIGYRGAQVFYNGLLPEIASQEEMPKVSGNGWAIGSFGGIVCLLLVLGAIMLLGDDGRQVLSTGLIVRLSLIFTAVYFAISALPMWFWLTEKAEKHNLPAGETYLSLAFKRLGATFRSVRSYHEFIKFIIAFLIYNDGILMVLEFGAILGAVLYGMEQQELIIFMIIVQLASVAGAYLFGLVADYFGGKRSLTFSLVLMILPIIWLYLSQTKLEFYIIGGLAGFALTGVQSVSRTVVGMFSPQGKSAEFYGFFAVAGRTSSFIGPPIFGLLTGVLIKRNINLLGMSAAQAEVMAHRLSVFSILIFLVVGLGLLLTVDEAKAKEAARQREDVDAVPVAAK